MFVPMDFTPISPQPKAPPMHCFRVLSILFGLLFVALPTEAEDGVRQHALSFAKAPKYGPDFKQLDYVDPQAPKGGAVQYAAIGGFDSFNPFIIRGEATALPGLYETLTTSTDDDVLSEYGLIAESMEVAGDNSWIVFRLRPQARWHDGKPITAADVVFSFNILREKGAPNYRAYYADVAMVEKIDDTTVKFGFSTKGNRELPIILGQLPILPKHFWEGRKFDEPSLEPPLGSGPYKLKSFEAGRSLTMERVPDYWGRDLPINLGTSNFDIVHVDYYRDPIVALEAFKAGAFDFRAENSAKQWATGYETPALRDGRMKMELIPHDNPQGMQAFVMNLRRPVFQDRRVRAALILAFDFEWSNKTLFFGQYKRSRSFFQNSDMAARGLPDAAELALLEPFRGKIPDEVFTTEYQPPVSDGSGANSDNLAKAAQLLESAGWALSNGRRMKDGNPLEFEFLLDAGNSAFERIAQPYLKGLERLGIKATLRLVDSAQYEKRVTEDFDYDMISSGFGQSLSPGNEQRDYWTSLAADMPGSSNSIGIKDPVVDALVDKIISAPTRDDLITACRALDRVLQWGYYVVPNWHLDASRIAYWDKFGRPAKLPQPTYGLGLASWWIDPAKEAAIAAKNAPADASGTNMQAEAATQIPGADRGRSPLTYLLYGAGAVAIVVILGAVLRRRRK
jgi:microcin C transport system substrate-binding protein